MTNHSFDGDNTKSGSDERRASCGGVLTPKPLPYNPPVGLKQGPQRPGLGGTNHGKRGTQGKY